MEVKMLNNSKVEVYLKRTDNPNGANQWVLPDCPYCGQTHWHGAGSPGEDLKLGPQGSRRPHCVIDGKISDDPDYSLIWGGKYWEEYKGGKNER